MSHPRPLQVVILAAGQGTRMRSGLPKVLHPIAGQAMVSHVIAAAATLQPQKTVAVVGHGASVVEATLADSGVAFALQSPQLGTGHAVQMALPALQPLPESGQVLILYGDVPLIQPATLKALLQAAGDGVGLHRRRERAVVSARIDQGRIDAVEAKNGCVRLASLMLRTGWHSPADR